MDNFICQDSLGVNMMHDNGEIDRLVTRIELCAAAKISYSTSQRLEKAGIILPEITLGRLRRYLLAKNLRRLRGEASQPD